MKLKSHWWQSRGELFAYIFHTVSKMSSWRLIKHVMHHKCNRFSTGTVQEPGCRSLGSDMGLRGPFGLNRPRISLRPAQHAALGDAARSRAAPSVWSLAFPADLVHTLPPGESTLSLFSTVRTAKGHHEHFLTEREKSQTWLWPLDTGHQEKGYLVGSKFFYLFVLLLLFLVF